MHELKIGDKLIDHVQGTSEIIDADHYDGIIFVSDGGVVFRRSLTDVQLMKKAPPKSQVLDFFKGVIFGTCVVALFTLVVVLAGKVVIYSQTGL